jgi:hypothetical protein
MVRWNNLLFVGTKQGHIQGWDIVDRDMCVLPLPEASGLSVLWKLLVVNGLLLSSSGLFSQLRMWNDRGECVAKLFGDVSAVFGVEEVNGHLLTGGSGRCIVVRRLTGGEEDKGKE